MNKLLVVLFTAIAISGSAHADSIKIDNIDIYGVVDLAVGATNNGVVSSNQISSQVTRLGFRGYEDLGDGLNAIWQIEQQIDVDNNSTTTGTTNPSGSSKTTFASRNSFLGLKDKTVGTGLLGIYDTPYKISTRKLDVFWDSLADNRTLLGGGASATNGGGIHDTRLGNEIVYLSPKLGGFSVAASYAAGSELVSTASQQKGEAYSLAGIYDAAPYYASLAYQAFKYGTANTGSFGATGTLNPGDKLTAAKLGLGYTLDALLVNFIYENTTSSILGLDKYGRSNWYLGTKYNLDEKDALKFAYTKAGNIGGVSNTGARQISVGYDHNLSKQTTIYVLYTKVSNDSGANYSFTTASSTAGGAAVALGNSPYGYAIGIKHTF